ncbi:DNA binding protein [Microbacterium phage Quhwah]|uniref:DNA binding protein n=1 Tax=Microbacterium phage Quhwah TaxID=2992929 RepID=A0A2Z4QB81_9CAUD|nr:DNA binding protein [Microbacterium phage Quhwah]AWY06778.1 DNA binding protein [Microbacterium phage Quhwah]
MTKQSDPLELIGLADIATILDLSPASVRTYHTDATRRRRDGEPRDQDMPAPDMVIGRTPAWKRETIDAWKSEREAAAQRNLDRLRQPRGPRTPEPVA